ncbi:hemoglobin subunit beta-2-like [Leptodactylus fuscus]
MANLTDKEINIISVFWRKLDVKNIGEESLSRLLLNFPTLKGQFTNLGDIRSYDAILHNPKVKELSEKIMGSVGAALKNINNLDKLIKHDFEKLNMGEANFKNSGLKS